MVQNVKQLSFLVLIIIEIKAFGNHISVILSRYNKSSICVEKLLLFSYT